MNIGSASMNLPLTSINTALIFLELLLKADEFIVVQIDVDYRLKRHRRATRWSPGRSPSRAVCIARSLRPEAARR
jgi:hypothetical protein